MIFQILEKNPGMLIYYAAHTVKRENLKNGAPGIFILRLMRCDVFIQKKVEEL